MMAFNRKSAMPLFYIVMTLNGGESNDRLAFYLRCSVWRHDRLFGFGGGFVTIPLIVLVTAVWGAQSDVGGQAMHMR